MVPARAALRLLVCAKCVETFLAHRGTSAHRLRTRSRAKNIARVTERPSFSPISRHALVNRRGRSTASSAALRLFVCAKCVETFLTHKGTSAHRLRTRSRAYSMARVTERPSFSPISRHALGHRRGRSTASSAALRLLVCAKCVETFLTHRGTSVHHLRTPFRARDAACLVKHPNF